MSKRESKHGGDVMPDLPQEHPDTTEARQQDMWLYQDKEKPRPETLLEFLQQTHEIGLEWYFRWNGLWKKVNPNYFRNKEDKDRWVREQELKAMAAWHMIRVQRMYWHEVGLWEGNPMDPDDKGKFIIPVLAQDRLRRVKEARDAGRRRRKHVELQSAVVKVALSWWRLIEGDPTVTLDVVSRTLHQHRSRLLVACAALEKFETEDSE